MRQSSAQRKRAIAKYKNFVREGVELSEIWSELKHQIYLGREKFVTRMQKKRDKSADLSEIPRTQRRAKAKPLAYYETRYKDSKRAMAAAYLTSDYTMKKIAEHFEAHYSTVSRVIKKMEEHHA